MMNRTRKFSAIALGLMFLIIIAGNSMAGEVGVTDDSILVGCSNSFSGPLVYPGTQLVNNGLESYIGYVNAMGGVNGRKILTQYYDDGYKPQNAVANTKRLVDQDKVFAILASQGTAPVMATVPVGTSDVAVKPIGVPSATGSGSSSGAPSMNANASVRSRL